MSDFEDDIDDQLLELAGAPRRRRGDNIHQAALVEEMRVAARNERPSMRPFLFSSRHFCRGLETSESQPTFFTSPDHFCH
jgi:hypothetical protein